MRNCYFLGDKVSTDFGRGQITKVIQRLNRNWNHAEYYVVKLERHENPHIFSPEEIRRPFYGLSTPLSDRF